LFEAKAANNAAVPSEKDALDHLVKTRWPRGVRCVAWRAIKQKRFTACLGSHHHLSDALKAESGSCRIEYGIWNVQLLESITLPFGGLLRLFAQQPT
jgi:hypothetical protein